MNKESQNIKDLLSTYSTILDDIFNSFGIEYTYGKLTDYTDLKWFYDGVSIKLFSDSLYNLASIEYPKELVNELKVSAKGIIMDLKYHYNRPRPYQLAEYYNIKLGEHVLESMKTPSYPSGHSAQGILIGKVLQTKLPINTNAFIEAGERISYSRNIGGAHYPSDSELGKIIGTRMYEYIIHRI